MSDSEVFTPGCVLVTGGAGFIGSNLVRWILEKDPEVVVVNFDLLTYAGNVENLEDVHEQHGAGGDGRYYFVRGDIRDFSTVSRLLRGECPETPLRGAVPRTPPPVDAVAHLAAESHVDRSIMGPGIFLETNVLGTLTLLEAWRAELLERPQPSRFLHVSTDEVYGTLGPSDPAFTEQTALAPNSPYAASKAGSDLLVRAYVETYGLPAIITRCSNNYGPYQFPEKLIPLMITRALRDEPLPVYGDGMNIRDWLYVRDHAEAMWTVLLRGVPGRVYNIGGESEMPNIEVVRTILALLQKPETQIRFVADRPGHDRRYAVNIRRLRTELGWSPRHTFQDGISTTVAWYLEHRTWWQRVLSEAYRAASAMYLTEP